MRIYSEGVGTGGAFTADGSEITIQGLNASRFAVDLSTFTRARLSVNLYSFSGPASSAKFEIEYSINNGTNWGATGVEVEANNTGLFVGEYTSLPSSVDADTIFRIVTSDETGNGGASLWPVFIDLEVK